MNEKIPISTFSNAKYFLTPMFWCVRLFIYLFETRSPTVPQPGLELMAILLPQPSKHQGTMCATIPSLLSLALFGY